MNLIERLRDCSRRMDPEIWPVFDEAADALERYEWVSVEERLPENKQKVLIRDRRHINTFGGPVFTQMYVSTSRNPWGEFLEVTHWMPLPEPPE